MGALVNDDELLMIIANIDEEDTEEPEEPVVTEGIEVAVDDRTVTVTYTGEAPTRTEVIQAVRAKLAEVNVVDVADVTFEDAGSGDVTFKVAVSGGTLTYTYDPADATVAAAD